VRLKDLIVKGLELALEQPATPEPFRQTFPLVKGTSGRKLSNEDVREALESMDSEEAQAFAAHIRR